MSLGVVLLIFGFVQVVNAYLICHYVAANTYLPTSKIAISLVIGMLAGWLLVAVGNAMMIQPL